MVSDPSSVPGILMKHFLDRKSHLGVEITPRVSDGNAPFVCGGVVLCVKVEMPSVFISGREIDSN